MNSSPAQVDLLAASLVGSLKRRFGLILAAVALLLIVDQALLQPQLVRLSVYAPQINIAGRQRMLSQKLVKSGLASMLATNESVRHAQLGDLRAALLLWRDSHEGLLHGNPELGLPPTISPDIREQFALLEPHYQAIVKTAEDLLQAQLDQTHVDTLLKQEALYLPKMDQIVSLYEQEARTQTAMLRKFGLAAAVSVIVLLVALGRMVLLPATRTIQQQVESLEQRVRERTTELTSVNKTLRQEIEIRHQAERRTQELAHQLAHTSRVLSLGQLASGLAHEINQPLAAIANHAATCALALKSDEVDFQRLEKSVESILGTAHRAGDIVRSMRNFLKPGEMPQCEVCIQDLVDDVVLICQPELQRHSVQLELLLDDSQQIVHVAATQIQQVILNLVQNAIQAQLDCPVERRSVQISSSTSGAELIIEVADAGPGFVETSPENACEPFFTTKTSGLGLGLAIARSIVQNHAGRLWAENRAQGAAVCFTLPLDSGHACCDVAEPYCVHR